MSNTIPPVVTPPPLTVVTFWDWLTPTRVHAIGVAAAAIGAALSHVVTGNVTIDGVVAVIAYVLVHLGVPDNTVTTLALQRLNLQLNRSTAARLAQLPYTPSRL